MQTVRDAEQFCRALMLDTDPENPEFSFAFLQPFLNLAYKNMRDEGMAATEDRMTQKVTVINNFPAGTGNLNAYQLPGQPLAGMIAPILIREKPAGADDTEYMDLKALIELYIRPNESFLMEYEWRDAGVYFIAATQNLDLQVRYESDWTTLSTEDQVLAIPNCSHILGTWTAGLVSNTLNAGTGDKYVADARHEIYLYLNRQIKASQTYATRQRPYRRRLGTVSSWGGGPIW